VLIHQLICIISDFKIQIACKENYNRMLTLALIA